MPSLLTSAPDKRTTVVLVVVEFPRKRGPIGKKTLSTPGPPTIRGRAEVALLSAHPNKTSAVCVSGRYTAKSSRPSPLKSPMMVCAVTAPPHITSTNLSSSPPKMTAERTEPTTSTSSTPSPLTSPTDSDSGVNARLKPSVNDTLPLLSSSTCADDDAATTKSNSPSPSTSALPTASTRESPESENTASASDSVGVAPPGQARVPPVRRLRRPAAVVGDSWR